MSESKHTPSTEAKIKHTGLNETKARAFMKRTYALARAGELPSAFQEAAVHIESLLAVIRLLQDDESSFARNRRLLEAGEQLAEAVDPFVTKVNGLPAVVRTIGEAEEVRHALAAYQEAAKP